MGMLDNFLRDLTRPIREIRSKIFGVKNVKDSLIGDINRLKKSVGIGNEPPKPPEPPKK